MPVEYVKEVERAQTAICPIRSTRRPIEQGIGVYYTDLNWGRISFAIIEDRKFKTGPHGVVPQTGAAPDHVTDPDYDPRTWTCPVRSCSASGSSSSSTSGARIGGTPT